MEITKLNFSRGKQFLVVVGDLLYEPVDCIVNAANAGLSHGGGVAAAISEAAGEELENECERIIRVQGRIPLTKSVVTTAGNLPFKGVIHAVGPRMGDGDEKRKLVKRYCWRFHKPMPRGGTRFPFRG